MSKAANSPTARLLQSSRLFSLPRPLPAASLETPSSTGTYRASDSATQLYPTHQAIATPASSHHRGDWGLKRAIPGRTTRSSIPSIRVLGQDTPDHITEFESATDHERSREKWAEMGVPIVIKGKNGRRDRDVNDMHFSAYEDFLDNTDPHAAPVELRHRTKGRDNKRSGMPTAVEPQRWKYSGPHIGAMQEGEFQRYVQRMLRARRDEWEQFLIGEFAKEDLKKERDEAFANARHFGPIESAPPERQRDLVVREAERKASELLAEAASSLDAEVETKAKEVGERLVAEAQIKAQEYEEESRRLSAPYEARTVLDRAERQAAIERPIIAREGDPDRSRASAIQQTLSSAAAEAHNILGAPFDPETSTIEHAYTLITDAETAHSAQNQAKLAVQSSWEAARLLSLRLSSPALAARQKELRDDHASSRLSSALTKYLTTFLDIPAVYSTAETNPADNFNLHRIAREFGFDHHTSEDAPPTTHPAAGLSHLRSNAFLPNHPLYGPQARESPILARVLQARTSSRGNAGGNNTYADIGVGGFVARDSRTSGYNTKLAEADPAHTLDVETPGGGKVWVHPRHAFVDETGRVHLSVQRADEEAQAVKEGKVEELEAKRQAGTGGFGRPSVGLPAERTGVRANYGTALPDLRRGAGLREGGRQGGDRGRQGYRRARGFDDELGRDGKGGVDENEAMRRIAELSRQG